MNKLFIPYELAVIAKEKGFNEPCFAFYDNMGDVCLEIKQPYEKIIGIRNGHLTNEVSAPIYSQIIDWFREKHKIHIRVLMIDDWDSWIFRIDTDGGMTPIIELIWNGKEYESYYEALNKAILEAFKLI